MGSTNRLRRLILATVVGGALLMAWWLNPGYVGPGRVVDGFSPIYPRTKVLFPDVSANAAGTADYEFTGLPTSELDFMLYVVDPQSGSAGSLGRRQSGWEVTLIDVRRNAVVCRAKGTPSATGDERWWLQSGGRFPEAFWHRDCMGLHLSRRGSYRLRIVVTPVLGEPELMLTPALQGGGVIP